MFHTWVCLAPIKQLTLWLRSLFIQRHPPNVYPRRLRHVLNYSRDHRQTCKPFLRRGKLPTKIQVCHCAAIVKKEGLDRNAPCNYRSLSNLNTLSKVLERLALVRIRQYLITSPNYNRAHSAYRRNHSTASALLRTLDAAYKAMDRGEATLLVALDIPAAFDTVVHLTLVQRLHSYFGDDGNILTWITSYLTERSQFVKIGSASAPHRTVVVESLRGPYCVRCFSRFTFR